MLWVMVLIELTAFCLARLANLSAVPKMVLAAPNRPERLIRVSLTAPVSA